MFVHGQNQNQAHYLQQTFVHKQVQNIHKPNQTVIHKAGNGWKQLEGTAPELHWQTKTHQNHWEQDEITVNATETKQKSKIITAQNCPS